MLFVSVKIRIISVTIQLTEPYIRSCKSLPTSRTTLLPDQYFTLPHLIPLSRSHSYTNQPTSYHNCHRHQEPNLWPWRMVPLWQPIRAALALSPSVELFQVGYTLVCNVFLLVLCQDFVYKSAGRFTSLCGWLPECTPYIYGFLGYSYLNFCTVPRGTPRRKSDVQSWEIMCKLGKFRKILLLDKFIYKL